jgi:glycine betaine catabolism B
MKIPLIDDLLNKVTMYRLTLYYLIFLLVLALVFPIFNLTNYSSIDVLIDAIVLVIVCFGSNFLFAKIFHAVTNIESVFITALILLFIIPVNFPQNIIYFALAGFLAMAIKYLPTIDKRHIFNPAAGAVAAIALISAEHSATWWIGTPIFFPFVFFGGLFIIRKIRREEMVAIFLATSILIISVFTLIRGGDLIIILKQSILSTALIFFAFIMFTEPLTSPPTKKLQYYYGVLVGILYATPQMRLLGFTLTPELALLFGNIYSFIVSPKYRLLLRLKEKIVVASNTYVFSFEKPEKFSFIPGQYMEWTLPHKHSDSRGNRRYFSISSSNKEDLQIAVRFHKKPSSYKSSMLSMNTNDQIIASYLSGDFTLPKNISKPLVFIAGGIGIAPFRSIVQEIIDKNLKVDIVLFYSNRNFNEIAFADVFHKATINGIKTIYTLTDKENLPSTWSGEVGHFNPEIIKKYIPDFKDRTYYISGPQQMVQSVESLLKKLSVSRRKIKTDYFPGY